MRSLAAPLLSEYPNDAEAHAAVARLIAAGTPGGRISVLTGDGGGERDAVATYADGVHRVHVGSRRGLARWLDAAAVAALRRGRVLVLVAAT